LVFIDSDVQIHPDGFTRIRRTFTRDLTLTAVFGSYDAAPAAGGTLTAFRNLLHHHVHQTCAGPASTFWAGLGAIRRDAFLSAGGFDAARFPRASVEDIELGMRLAERSERLYLDPALQGTHLKHWRLAQMIRTDLFARGLPWALTLIRSHRRSSALNLGRRHRLSALASVGVLAGLLARRWAAAGCAIGAVLVLNRSFYALLWRRGGPWLAVSGIGLHILHHLTGTVALSIAIVVCAKERAVGDDTTLRRRTRSGVEVKVSRRRKSRPLAP